MTTFNISQSLVNEFTVIAFNKFIKLVSGSSKFLGEASSVCSQPIPVVLRAGSKPAKLIVF
jgi:hypothetical protein